MFLPYRKVKNMGKSWLLSLRLKTSEEKVNFTNDDKLFHSFGAAAWKKQ